MVLREHDEKAGLFSESRISMAEVLFGKDDEGWTEKEGRGRNLGLFHPGCCHTCGSCMGVNGVQGHDWSLRDKYEGRTLEQCYRLKEIEKAGPCSLCTSLVGYLDGMHTSLGEPKPSKFAQHPVPTRHLVGDCPLGRVDAGSAPRKYMALQHLAQGLDRRREEKLANMVADTRRRDLLAQQKNASVHGKGQACLLQVHRLHGGVSGTGLQQVEGVQGRVLCTSMQGS